MSDHCCRKATPYVLKEQLQLKVLHCLLEQVPRCNKVLDPIYVNSERRAILFSFDEKGSVKYIGKYHMSVDANFFYFASLTTNTIADAVEFKE